MRIFPHVKEVNRILYEKGLGVFWFLLFVAVGGILTKGALSIQVGLSRFVSFCE